jgi:hypothetical protein
MPLPGLQSLRCSGLAAEAPAGICGPPGRERSRRAAVNKKWSPTRPSKSTSAMSWSLARPQSQTKSATEKLSARERMALRAMAMTD